MGSVCSGINFFRDISFSPRYKEQMTEMMLTVIEHACDSVEDYEGQTRRIKNLKKQMVVVRGLIDSCPELTDVCKQK